jgi:hypothetical protein
VNVEEKETSGGSPVTGVAVIAFALGSLVWAIYATAAEAFPARNFIELQALWDGGYYGVKLTFACVWFSMIAVPVVLALLAMPVVQRLSRKPTSEGALDDRELVMLEEHERPDYAVYAAGFGTLTVALLYLFVALPDVFVPIRYVGQVALLLTPVLAVAAAAFVAQWLGVDGVVAAIVEQIEVRPRPGSSTEEEYTLVTRGGRWTIEEASAQRLRPGVRVVVVSSPLSWGVRCLAAELPDSESRVIPGA